MTTDKHDPWALLRDARDSVALDAEAAGNSRFVAEAERVAALLSRIDVALAAHEAEERVVPPKVEWTWSHGGWCEGVSIRIDEVFDAKCWSWEITGTASTQDEARAAASQAAAIAAARGMK